MRAAGNSTGTSGAGHSPEREDVLVAQTRSRSLSRPELRESLVGGAMAADFVVTGAIVAARSWPAGGVSLVACAGAVVALTLASMAEFEIGRGAGVPTQLVFVPVQLLLPTGLAPVLVMAAYVLERLAHRDWRTRSLRLHITVGSCWFSLGPTLVLLAAGVGPPSWWHWPVYVLAFAAQIATDLVTSVTSEWLVFGQAASTTAGHVGRTGLIDAALSPAGLALAIAGRGALGCALLAGLPLIVLLRRMAEDRDADRAGERAGRGLRGHGAPPRRRRRGRRRLHGEPYTWCRLARGTGLRAPAARDRRSARRQVRGDPPRRRWDLTATPTGWQARRRASSACATRSTR